MEGLKILSLSNEFHASSNMEMQDPRGERKAFLKSHCLPPPWAGPGAGVCGCRDAPQPHPTSISAAPCICLILRSEHHQSFLSMVPTQAFPSSFFLLLQVLIAPWVEAGVGAGSGPSILFTRYSIRADLSRPSPSPIPYPLPPTLPAPSVTLQEAIYNTLHPLLALRHLSLRPH